MVNDREIMKWSNTGGLGALKCMSVTLSGVSVSNRSKLDVSRDSDELTEVIVIHSITKGIGVGGDGRECGPINVWHGKVTHDYVVVRRRKIM